MYLVEVQLRNWRSYRNATFFFPRPDIEDSRKVILVGAQNGVGKTSLLTALYLGLFGRDAMHLIEGIRIAGSKEEKGSSYKALMERTLHRPAIKGNDPYSMVKLKFETPSGEQISIRRKWGFTRGGKVRDLNTQDGEEVIVELCGEPKIFPNWQDANDRIAELLFPSNVMPCFFFDGEQAQERVEAAGGRPLLEAVKTLYGTGLLDQLKQSLQHFINNERSNLRRDVGNIREDELDIKRDELQKLKADLAQNSRDLELKRKDLEEFENKRNRLTSELYQLVGDSATDVSQYADTINALRNEQTTLKQKLTNGLASFALPLALTRNGQLVLDTINSERIRDEWLHLKKAATGKANKIVEQVLPEDGSSEIEPRLTNTQITQLRCRLESALEALWSPPPENCATDYRFIFLKEADRSAIYSKIKRIQEQGVPDLQQAVITWNTVNTQLREAQRKFDAIKDIEPKLHELKEAISEAGKRITFINSEINSCEIKEKDLTNRIRDIRAALGQMEKRRIIADPVQAKLSVANQVVEVLDEAGERLIPLCKEALEERCTFHFKHMISDEFHNFSVKFDSDTEPRLENESQVIFVAGLSGAQKRAFGLAFTLAVADVSRQKAPIVIDTPVGNMDSFYRDRVLRHVANAAPGQVIFLSHDEEISPEYRNKLSSYISKCFLLSFKQVEDGC